MGSIRRLLVLPAARIQLEALLLTKLLPRQYVGVLIVLLAANGKANRDIAIELTVTERSVINWKRRFLEKGFEAFVRPALEHRGRPKGISQEQRIRTIVEASGTGPRPPIRVIAARVGISVTSVWRILSNEHAPGRGSLLCP